MTWTKFAQGPISYVPKSYFQFKNKYNFCDRHDHHIHYCFYQVNVNYMQIYLGFQKTISYLKLKGKQGNLNDINLNKS